MTIKSSATIHPPEADKLALLASYSEMASVIRFVNDNPKAVADMGKTIADCYKLTQDEINARDAALKATNDAKTEFLSVKLQHANTLDMIKAAKEAAEEAVKAIYAGARKTKEDADRYIADKKKEIGEENVALLKREDKVKDREDAASEAEKSEKAWREEKKNWEKEKEDWEADYSARLEKLAAREKKSFKK